MILASAVLHHLRTEEEWRLVFAKFFAALAPGGSLWIFDIVESDIPSVQAATWTRYGRFLEAINGPEYRDNIMAYIEKEDTPRSVAFQLELLRAAGFTAVDVLHKNLNFAAFGAVKG